MAIMTFFVAPRMALRQKRWPLAIPHRGLNEPALPEHAP